MYMPMAIMPLEGDEVSGAKNENVAKFRERMPDLCKEKLHKWDPGTGQ